MDIRERIAKLLALAESDYEAEAKAALLKARELMAEHKLRPKECVLTERAVVKKENVGIFYTQRKYHWAEWLGKIVAEHYCCKAYHTVTKGRQTCENGLIGLEEDFAVCKNILIYAFEFCKKKADEIFKQHSDMFTASYRRSLAEAYGDGFCAGLMQAYQAQDKEKKQEWGLVLVTPQPVLDLVAKLTEDKKKYKLASFDGARAYYGRLGLEDGKKFDPTHRIEDKGQAQLALPG